jgi:chloramphenicol O-acetyltransferase type A
MHKILDIEKWDRKNQYHFFKNYDNPFFNVCSEIEVTKTYNFTKEKKRSFFITSLYLSLKAVNEIEEFRYRIKDDKVLVYDSINAGSTVLNDNNTFSFCYFDYRKDFKEFEIEANKSLQKLVASKGELEPRDHELNMIHYSVIPWISFSSISHPRKFSNDDSIPKIVFGKYHELNGKLIMPISVEAHHSLMDGYHLGKYLQHLQNLLNEPQIYLE